jgi:hypothetical protein
MPKYKAVYNLSSLLALLSILSCSKEKSPMQQFVVPTYSGISVTNAAVGTTSISFFVDNQQVQLTDSLAFGTTAFFNLANNAHPDNPLSGFTPYTDVSYGYRELEFGFPHAGYYVAEMKNYFEPGVKYSVFVADTLEHGQLQCVMLRDDLSILDSGKAQIRFINLAPDAPAMDLWAFPYAVQADGYKLFSNRAFPIYDYNSVLTAQEFSIINAGPYYFAATVAGTPSILLQGGLIVPNQSVVTIYSKGLLSGTGDKQLDVGVIEYLR